VIRDRRYKYVHFAGLPPLLYDLERDPGELRDRAADPDYAEIVLDRAQRMLSLRMAHVDRALTGIKLTTRGRFEIERARRRAPAR